MIRLFRVTAWVKRFAYNVQARIKGKVRKVGNLEVTEVDSAESDWIKLAQQHIKNNGKYDQIVSSLRVKESEGMLKCQGRLENSDLDANTRFPV